MQLIEILDEFRKTGSKTMLAQELGTTAHSSDFRDLWKDLQEKNLITQNSRDRYIPTRKAVIKMADHYKKTRCQ